MSDYRPHVYKHAKPPPIKDDSILAKLTPQEKAEWLRSQPEEMKQHMRDLRERYDLILKAQKAGLLGWEMDPNHYRNGTPYCKCPEGTVAAHNERFAKILESVNDGR